MATPVCSATSVDFLRGQNPRHVYLPQTQPASAMCPSPAMPTAATTTARPRWSTTGTISPLRQRRLRDPALLVLLQPDHAWPLHRNSSITQIVKPLFCISRVNFVEPAKGFTSLTTDSQINIPTTTTSAFNSHINSLASISNYGTCRWGAEWAFADSMPWEISTFFAFFKTTFCYL